MLTKGTWQVQVVEEGEESVANTETQIPVSKALGDVCYIPCRATIVCISAMCEKHLQLSK